MCCFICYILKTLYEKVLNCYNFKMIVSLKSSTQQENYKIAIHEEQPDDSISNQDSVSLRLAEG